jgi:hypothetical protein
MARRTGASAPTRALTKAQEAVALRDAERIKREKQLEATLADYYQAQGEVERIRVEAEVAAAPYEAAGFWGKLSSSLAKHHLTCTNASRAPA